MIERKKRNKKKKMNLEKKNHHTAYSFSQSKPFVLLVIDNLTSEYFNILMAIYSATTNKYYLSVRRGDFIVVVVSDTSLFASAVRRGVVRLTSAAQTLTISLAFGRAFGSDLRQRDCSTISESIASPVGDSCRLIVDHELVVVNSQQATYFADALIGCDVERRNDFFTFDFVRH
jgi:hypothetical protein